MFDPSLNTLLLYGIQVLHANILCLLNRSKNKLAELFKEENITTMPMPFLLVACKLCPTEEMNYAVNLPKTVFFLIVLKAVDTIGICQRLAFTVGVSQHKHKKTNL